MEEGGLSVCLSARPSVPASGAPPRESRALGRPLPRPPRGEARPGPTGSACPAMAGVPRPAGPAERRPLPCGAPGAPVTQAVYLQSRPWKEEKCKRRESERGKELPELRE